MYILNTTFNIELSVLDECLSHIKENFISDHLQTGLFSKAIFTEVLSQDSHESKTYSLQFFCPSQAHLSQYQKFHQQDLVKFARTYKGKLVYFQTSMQVISEKEA